MRGPDHVRFHEYYIPEPNTGCFLWIGAMDSHGYGNFTSMAPRKRSVLAHRMAWLLDVGPIPDGMVLDHLCRVRACVNVRHLRVATQRENTLCGMGPAALRAQQTHCKQGHAFDAGNTYMWRGTRACRVCRRDAKRRWRQS